MRVRNLILGTFLVVVSAGGLPAQEKTKEKKPAKDRNLITTAEIEKSSAKDAYQVVQTLRPVWLSNRGTGGLRPDPNAPQSITGGSRTDVMGVYVDGVRRGSLPELRDIPIEQVKEIRFFSAEAAVSRFGSDNPLGAVEVTMKK